MILQATIYTYDIGVLSAFCEYAIRSLDGSSIKDDSDRFEHVSALGECFVCVAVSSKRTAGLQPPRDNRRDFLCLRQLFDCFSFWEH